MEVQICKHFMYGYCKLKQHCPKQHVDVICPNYRECDNNGCVKRHPNPCKYFDKYKKCRIEKCAYSHDKEGNDLIIENMENQLSALKHEVEEMNKSNKQKLDLVRVEAGANSKQLCQLMKTVADIVQRLEIMDEWQKDTTERDVHVDEPTDETEVKTCDDHKKKTKADSDNQEEMIDMEKVTATSKDKRNETEETSAEVQKEKYKCEKCDFISNKEITMNKHKNTKHVQKLSGKECSLCEDSFTTEMELKKHIDEHIDEIENLDIVSLTNGHDLFECNLCSFESGLGDSIRKHIIDHVLPQRHEEATNLPEKEVRPLYKCLLDEYDDDGNYIGNNPKYMDKEESDLEED